MSSQTAMGAAPDTTPPLVARVSSALLDIQAREPAQTSRLALWTVCVLFAALMIWSLVAKLDIVAVAEGRLVPQTYTKIVQPLEAGTIKQILVKEGQEVKEGQVLMRLDETLVSAEGRSVNQELELRRLQLERIDAELADRPMKPVPSANPGLQEKAEAQFRANRRALADALGAAVAARDKASADLGAAEETRDMLIRSLPSYEQSAAAFEQLANQSLAPRQQALEKRREAIEKGQALRAQRQTIESLDASIRSEAQKINQIKSGYRSKLEGERSEMLSQVQKLTEEATKQQYRGQRLELRAPQDGIVKDVATTTIGAVVQPGTVLLTVVPRREALVAEVQIRNEDVGFVEIGQPARIKVAAFPFQKYGMFEGMVVNLGAEASRAEKSSADREDELAPSPQSFKALVRVNVSDPSKQQINRVLRPGMQVSAEIVEGKRTVMEYLLSPVRAVTHASGSER